MRSPPPTITRPAQVRALVAPARQEIVDALETAGPCSVAALAALLARPADGLYHHLRVLARVGLIREVERRKSGRRVYVMYDLAVRPLVMSYERPVRSGDVASVVGALQRLALRDFRRALADGMGPTRGDRRALWGARARGWLGADDLRRLNSLLAQAMDIVRAGRRPPDADPSGPDRHCVSLQFVLTPSGFPARRRRADASRRARPRPR